MKKLIKCMLLASVCISVSVSAQDVVFSNWVNRDTVFLLPGELFTNVYNIQTTATDSNGYILSYFYKCYDETLKYNNYIKGDVSYFAVNFNGNAYIGHEPNYTYVKSLPDSSNTAVWLRTAACISFVSSGVMARYSLSYSVDAMFRNLTTSAADGQENFCFLDRYRGDINGDNKVDSADVALAAGFVDDCFPNSLPGRYAKDGNNFGAIILPGQSIPTTLVGPTLLNIWVHNHNDPIVQNLGFGQLISQFNLQHALAKKAVLAPLYTIVIVGNKLTVSTKPNSAINVYTFVGCKLWHKDAFADANGQWTVSIPDPAAKYTVEICELGGSINPTAAYQKPAVKNINTSQKFSGQSAVYSLDGRRIANVNHAAGLNIVQMQNGATRMNFSNINRLR
jgi:hypothetical protein